MAEGHATPSGAANGAANGEPGVLRTLLLAFAVCGACAAVLTASVVALRPYQVANQKREQERRIRSLVERLPGMEELAASGALELELAVVEVATGAPAPDVDPEPLQGGEIDPRDSDPLPAERDGAGVGRRPRHAAVYRLSQDGALHTVILPVSGRGYLSMMHGWLAVGADGNTVRGITFTRHEETPGLGAEIENPDWQALWADKRIRDESGAVRIRVLQEPGPEDAPEAEFEVAGISGATKTSEGVSALVRFWTGPDGFGPYLERLRAETSGAAAPGEGDRP